MGAATSAIEQVAVTNLTPTFWSVCVLIAVSIGALIKVWPLLDRQKRDGDASLRHDLLGELAALRRENADERKRCDDEMRALRDRHDKEIGELRQEIATLYRRITSGNSAALSLFEPKTDLPDDMKARLRALGKDEG